MSTSKDKFVLLYEFEESVVSPIGTIHVSRVDSYYRALVALEEHFDEKVDIIKFENSRYGLHSIRPGQTYTLKVRFCNADSCERKIFATQNWIY